jgi:disulfide bond formation protein DsbB
MSGMNALRPTALIVLLASLALVGGALLFQHVGGLVPCTLCLYQRWPYYGAIGLALIALAVPRERIALLCLGLCGIGFGIGLGVALYHVGVEQHWLAGPTACSAPQAAPTSIEALTAQLLGQKPVRCDEVQWSLLGVSLAGWNVLASLGLVIFLMRNLFRLSLKPVTP